MIPKFKAYDLTENEWINVGRIVLCEKGELWYLQGLDENFKDIDPPYFKEDLGKAWVLLQSTGLKDKHGKEIYEEDIVQDEEGDIAYIVFLKKDMGYFVGYKNSDRRLEEVDNYQFEILGNIYEHPHLLEEE